MRCTAAHAPRCLEGGGEHTPQSLEQPSRAMPAMVIVAILLAAAAPRPLHGIGGRGKGGGGEGSMEPEEEAKRDAEIGERRVGAYA